MAIYRTSGSLRAATVINLLAGIWMIIAPFALGASSGARWNDVIFGILILLCALGRMAQPAARGYSVANFIFGIWLIISGWIFAGAGMHWNNTVTGIIVLICAWVAVRQVAVVTAFPESGTGTGTTRRAA